MVNKFFTFAHILKNITILNSMKKYFYNILISFTCALAEKVIIKRYAKIIILFITLFTGFILFFSSCSKNPTAGFTMSPGPYAVGDSITFTNNSTNAGDYEWSFGDHTESWQKNPKHAYTLAGNYTVSLTSIGKNYSTNSTSKSFNVTGTISIFEGVGIAGLNLSDIWFNIKNMFKGQDTSMSVYYDIPDGYYIHYLKLPASGITIDFFNINPTTIDSGENVDEIQLVSPYNGYTTKGITFGNNISLVLSTYGMPTDTSVNPNNDSLYQYFKFGVQFWTNNPSPEVTEIDVIQIPNSSDQNKSRKLLTLQKMINRSKRRL